MADLRITVENDRTAVNLLFEGQVEPVRLDAVGLEDIIRGLVQVRTMMLPDVPMHDPEPGTRFPKHPALRWHLMPDPDVPGAIRLCLLQAGVGWSWTTLPSRPAGVMAGELFRLAGMPPKVSDP